MKKTSAPRGNFHRFLFFLGLLAVLQPFLRSDPLSRVILNLLLGAILASGVLLYVRRRRVMAIGVILSLAALVSGALQVLLPSRGMAITRQACLALFLTFTAGVLLNAVLSSGKVTSEKLSGAVCVFLLIGFLWATLFSVVELVTPGSLHVSQEEQAAMDEALRHGEPNSPMIYFSFVTLTTLGYGDVLPVSPVARTLAWIEAVLGQLYLTILVARLVGMHLTHSGPTREP
jgi:hypothetical protein